MGRAIRFIGIGGGIFAVVIIVGAAVMQWRYGVVLPGPQVPHAEIASDRTALRMGFSPDMARSLIEARNPVPLPPWTLPYVLPYEAAAFADPDVTASEAYVAVFVNPRRAGTMVAQAVNKGGFLRRALAIDWQPEGLHPAGRGVLLAEGAMPLEPQGVALLRENWGIVAPLAPLTLEGGHLFELVLDMRDGRGFLLLAEFIGYHQPPNAMTHPSQIVHLLYKLSEIRLFVDVAGPDELAATLRLELRPDLEEGDAKSMSFLLNTIMSQQGPRLRATTGLEIQGTSTAEGLTVTGEYAIMGIQRLFADDPAASNAFAP